jgi:hypothetical protein
VGSIKNSVYLAALPAFPASRLEVKISEKSIYKRIFFESKNKRSAFGILEGLEGDLFRRRSQRSSYCSSSLEDTRQEMLTTII